MADDVRDTQHPLEVGYASSSEEVRDTHNFLDVAYNLVANPGDVRDTSHNLEAAESMTGEEARITSNYLECAYNPGPPLTDLIMDTHHFLEVAYLQVFNLIAVECNFGSQFQPGVRRGQGVCQ